MQILIMLHFQLSYDDVNVNLKNGKLGNDNSDRDHPKSVIDVRLMALSTRYKQRKACTKRKRTIFD